MEKEMSEAAVSQFPTNDATQGQSNASPQKAQSGATTSASGVGGSSKGQSSPPQGHTQGVGVGGIASDRLKSFVERIERLEEEKKAIADDIKDVYAESKSAGFDVKVMRQVIRLRKLDAADRAEQEEILDLYKHALDMI